MKAPRRQLMKKKVTPTKIKGGKLIPKKSTKSTNSKKRMPPKGYKIPTKG